MWNSHSNNHSMSKPMKKQIGASLIEAMVAVLIVGFGLLGVGAMQSRAIAMNQSAYYRGIAADLAADLAERVRALRSPFMAGADIIVPPPAPPDFSLCRASANCNTQCTPPTNGSSYGVLVQTEMAAWNTLRVRQLPVGSTCTLLAEPSGTGGFVRYTLTLTWLDNRKDTAQRQVDRDASYTVVIE
jgi:type IV pilus assembly protein PilV